MLPPGLQLGVTLMKILGIELGSTRIKSVLIDENAEVLASEAHTWENKLVDGYWSYSDEEIQNGVRDSFTELAADYKSKYGEALTEIDSIGISAMMHGYIPFDKNGNQLVPFRTWRNTCTSEAAGELSAAFKFNIPQRWTVAHYYQAVLSGEPHVKDVVRLTSLAGYVHYLLTGKNVLGTGEASGIFPLNNGEYDKVMLDELNSRLKAHGIDTKFEDIIPPILTAGDVAGTLTKEGALLLDPTGTLKPGAKFCPPEGDAQTGMVATNSIAPGTANVSAGTSAFLMAVLEKNMSNYYEEIDVMTTPVGHPVAMIQVNNFTCEINAWSSLFEEVIALGGGTLSGGELFSRLFNVSADADTSIGGLMGYNFLSGEHIVNVHEGRPIIARTPTSTLTLPNFMKLLIYSALGSFAIGMDTIRKENIKLTRVCGHGGFFKTPVIGQSAMSAALGAPVTVMKNSGEGGAWGIALLALYTLTKRGTLAEFLDGIFSDTETTTVMADDKEKAEFAAFVERYRIGLPWANDAAGAIK